MKRFLKAVVCLLLAAFAIPHAVATCGAEFCTVNTSWDAQDPWGDPGVRLDLRYEYVKQDQPRAGSDRVSVGQVPRHHDEVLTTNRNWVATLDYTWNADWAIAASLPLVDRSHFHVHNHHGASVPESWQFEAAGDARVLARRRLATFESQEPRLGTLASSFGLKLPTGRRDVRNADGDLAERSLQPGTGTTDVLLGVHYAELLPSSGIAWFAQGALQLPLGERDGYRPGRRLSLDAGLRYELSDALALLLQVNALARGRDRGAQAEPADSGGIALYLAPGLSYALDRDLRIYAFAQWPLAQHVNGVQLTARRGAVLGLSASF